MVIKMISITTVRTGLRLAFLCLGISLLFNHNSDQPSLLQNRILAVARGESFDYAEWELQALWNKAQQELWGYHAFIPEADRSAYVLAYFDRKQQLSSLESQLAQPQDLATLAHLQTQHHRLTDEINVAQALVEHIIEGQVSSILRDEGLAFLGQVLPPVTMRFLDIPDVLVVSPREEIHQAMTLTLQPMTFEERIALEARIAQAVPDYAVWITPIGGVGVWPAMITETDHAVVAFEITAHEWTHHYLIFFPLGLGYFANPETRIINETTATVMGNEVGNLVIQRFYAEELAAGRVYLQEVPDYRSLLAAIEAGTTTPQMIEGIQSLPFTQTYGQEAGQARAMADYLLAIDRPQAAQLWLEVLQQQAQRLGQQPASDPNLGRPSSDQRGWISQTRVEADYLLGLGLVDAAEWSMTRGQQQAGIRLLNQAWFAFNAGYQANPVVQTLPDGTPVISTSGGGGDPMGAAIYEVRARAGGLKRFLELMRGITTREELFDLLNEMKSTEAD